MKKVIAICGVLFLSACKDPIPSEQWTIGNHNLSTVKGFEDCTMTVIKMYENTHSINLVRCPNSAVTANQTVPTGKTSTNITSVITDVTPADSTRLKEAEAQLDAHLRSAQKIIDELNKSKQR